MPYMFLYGKETIKFLPPSHKEQKANFLVS